MDGLKDSCIRRYMLPDTLGVQSPTEVKVAVQDITQRYPQLHFEFHAHNDYDLAVANALAAVQAGAKGLHQSTGWEKEQGMHLWPAFRWH